MFMTVRLLGLGCVGAPLAVRLAPHCDFALILSAERVLPYREQGCIVNGQRYDFPIAEEAEDNVDLIIVACKNTDLAGAIEDLRPHVGPSTVIMSLLNGIDSERKLGEAFGEEKIIYSFITNLSSVRNGRSIDCFTTRGGLIKFNEKDSTRTPRIDRIEELFKESDVWYEVSDNILHDIWWKFSFNICVNSLSAMMDLNYEQMCDNAPFYRAIRMLYHEIRAVSGAEGVALDEKDEEQAFTVLSNMHGVGKTSMHQDVEAGRPTENQYFALSLGNLGRKNGIPTPLCDFVYNLVEAKANALR